MEKYSSLGSVEKGPSGLMHVCIWFGATGSLSWFQLGRIISTVKLYREDISLMLRGMQGMRSFQIRSPCLSINRGMSE